jgi:hypothetical protein
MTRRAVEWTCRATVETTLAALQSSGSSKLLELSGHKPGQVCVTTTDADESGNREVRSSISSRPTRSRDLLRILHVRRRLNH